MDMLRTLIALIVLIVYLVLSLPLMAVLWLVRLFTPRATLAMQRIVCAALSVIAWISGARVTTAGLENLPQDTPVLFIGNHQSFFDVILGYPQLKMPLAYLCKKSFLRYPLLNLNMIFLRCPFIDRNDLKQSIHAIKKATALVEEGMSVFVFPEGSRNKSGEELPLMPFHDGAFTIAKRSGVPMVPVAYTGTAAIFENHFPFIKAGNVTIEYGEPVRFADLPADARKHAGAYFEGVIAEMVRKNVEDCQE